MEFHVITATERALVMETDGRRIVQVLPAPAESLPPGARTQLTAKPDVVHHQDGDKKGI
jgi:hypothetical protein